MSTHAGFQLFPPPPSTTVSPKRNGKSSVNPSRKPSARRHAIQPQSPPQSAVERSQSPTFSGAGSPQQYIASGRFSPPPNTGHDQVWNQQSQQRYSQPKSAEESRSQTPILMQNISNASHSNPQAQFRPQTPLAQIDTSISPTRSPPRQKAAEPQVIRSIFPTYNPDIRLEHQDYYPTVHVDDDRVREIPRAVLSKRPYSPSISDQVVPSLPSMKSQLQRNPSLAGTVRGGSTMQTQAPSRSVYSHNNGNSRIISSPPLRQGPTSFPQTSLGNRGSNGSPTMEQASSTEELKELWKVTNGWRVSKSEGRVFVLEMTSDPEEPVHTLSSTTDPFYTIRIEPTSTSAHLTMHRHDPSKANNSNSSPTSKLKSNLGLTSSSTKTPSTTNPTLPLSSSKATGSSSSLLKPKSSSSGGKADEKTIEVLTTTLEETHRKLPPNDGLVALLYPTAASSLVISHQQSHPNIPDTTIRAVAERECARLVWDEDSQHYYLVHPCLSQPFIIRIAKSPAWSKVEYTLEHPSLPHDIARLVRGVGGVGKSWCVIDSGTAGGLEGVYVVDVAVCALVVVAVAEEKGGAGGGCGGGVERFEGPPKAVTIDSNSNSNNRKSKSTRNSRMDMNLTSSPKFAFTDSPLRSPKSSKFTLPHFLFSSNPKNPKSAKSTKSNPLSIFKAKANKTQTQNSGIEIDLNTTTQDFEFEGDLESQESSFKFKGQNGGKVKEEKLPFLLRCLAFGFRCAIWVVSAAFGCAVAVVVGVGGCAVRRVDR